MLDALIAKENKAASGTSGSQASVPPQKKRRLIQVDSSPDGDKSARTSNTAGIQVEEEQHNGTTLSPSPPVVHPTKVGEVEGAENISTTKSPVSAKINEVGGLDQSIDRHVAMFNPQPYIPQQNRLVTIENSALADSHVGFALATSITPLEDQKNLKAIKILDLESKSFQCLTVVSLFCVQSLNHNFLCCTNHFLQYSIELQGAQHFIELISRYAKERKDNKAMLKSAKKEATDSKNKLSTLQLAYDEKIRLADKSKYNYQK